MVKLNKIVSQVSSLYMLRKNPLAMTPSMLFFVLCSLTAATQIAKIYGPRSIVLGTVNLSDGTHTNWQKTSVQLEQGL
jgi:hypothetical protein